jgi:hypothetical protein
MIKIATMHAINNRSNIHDNKTNSNIGCSNTTLSQPSMFTTTGILVARAQAATVTRAIINI